MTKKIFTEDKNRNADNKETANDKPPALEWLAAGIGLILVVGAIGFLIYSTVSQTGKPPVLTAKADSVTANEGGYLVKFSLENKGEENAADVSVEGKLMRGEKEIEPSSTVISYAPSASKQEGGLIFTKNPGEFELKIRAVGYANP